LAVKFDDFRMTLPSGMNLMTNLKPPKAPYVGVRCLVDHGQMELENGEVILLQKDSIHYIPRNECEMLIRAGVLEHLTDEM
jgi:GINS complex subunit 1